MFDLLQAVCDDLEKTRTLLLTDVNRKLEEICESPESSRFKFLESQRQHLEQRETALLDQRLQLWLLTNSSLGTREEDKDEETFCLPNVIAIFVPICILAIVCLHLVLPQQSRLKFVQI